MDTILISSHSLMRWAVLLFGLYAITKSVRGLMKNQEYTSNHNMAATLFVASVHLQALLGLLLYVARGWVDNFSNMGDTMKNSAARYWTVEHSVVMLLAIILVQVGRSKSKKATEARRKHKTSLIYFLIGFILILAMIPWPFRADEIARSLWP
jgi:uncharacterized membrane protein